MEMAVAAAGTRPLSSLSPSCAVSRKKGENTPQERLRENIAQEGPTLWLPHSRILPAQWWRENPWAAKLNFACPADKPWANSDRGGIFTSFYFDYRERLIEKLILIPVREKKKRKRKTIKFLFLQDFRFKFHWQYNIFRNCSVTWGGIFWI